MAILFTVIGLSVLILVHELGHFLAAKFFKVRVDEFGFGFPPRLFARAHGETTYSVNALLFGGFVKIHGMGEETEEHPRSFSAQRLWRRVSIVVAGVLANLIAGWLALSLVFMVGAPPHLMLTGVAPDSPAAAAGLARGDVVAEVRAGDRVLRDPVGADDFIAAVGDAVRQGAPVAVVTGVGKETREVSLAPREAPPEGEGPLGVSLTEVGVPRTSLLEGFGKGAEESWILLKLIAGGFVNFFASVFQRPEVLKEVAGPVGVVAAAAQAGSLGFAYLLHFLGLISINLVVLNLIPFPALDGGQVLFLLIEKLKGSPIPVKFERIVNAAGFVFLLLLMVLVTVQDVGRL
ncbi:hypothetical protein COU12_02590 [Candidatus Jorgensenbacteria bacterium CG10_big_fil_rev_8_21_14_0_10_54_38]|uniref:Peptidase M50 domain-containing protein n=2 Tax=Candidatus Joergenseniibacteriota TaxID=1752739 RepID=A0A2M6WFJ2_9BACT|nr:MAG: hypothetical protein COX26_00305 [Candidatus Jorgensenbacteria bacterium CG23_combo_of_CG06-09_8_20_14_all_54_14]PIT91557.1 MAG: hypothetical protein COU12_02590 [Candidatus Jorgensenbacteria bacterium CG10_big_fil_rev_8_21_14_0_10_54_38]